MKARVKGRVCVGTVTGASLERGLPGDQRCPEKGGMCRGAETGAE